MGREEADGGEEGAHRVQVVDAGLVTSEEDWTEAGLQVEAVAVVEEGGGHNALQFAQEGHQLIIIINKHTPKATHSSPSCIHHIISLPFLPLAPIIITDDEEAIGCVLRRQEVHRGTSSSTQKVYSELLTSG